MDSVPLDETQRHEWEECENEFTGYDSSAVPMLAVFSDRNAEETREGDAEEDKSGAGG